MRKKHKSMAPHIVGIVFVLAAVIAACTFFPTLKEMGYKQFYPVKYEAIVSAAAEKYDLPESVVYGVIRTESGFDAGAQSHAGAKGLMQLTDETFLWMQEVLGEAGKYEAERLYEPEINIQYGCALLRRLLDYFGSTDTALAAYNAGIGNVSSWLENTQYSKNGSTLDTIPFTETENYVNRVRSAAEKYRELYSMD